MNYRHVYMCIVAHAKSEENLGIRVKGNGNYYERHHILPRSLFPLWKKRKSNTILLTAREHFFCHQLLTKIYPTQQMFFALHAFVVRPNADYKITSKEYERIKILYSKAWSERITGNSFAKGHHWTLSKETRERMSIAFRTRPTTEKMKLSAKRRGEDLKGKTYEEIYGKEKALKIKEKLSKTRTGKSHKSLPCSDERRIKEIFGAKNRLQIKCIETGEIFPSIRRCGLRFNIDNKKLSKYTKIGKGFRKNKGEFAGRILHFVLI